MHTLDWTTVENNLLNFPLEDLAHYWGCYQEDVQDFLEKEQNIFAHRMLAYTNTLIDILLADLDRWVNMQLRNSQYILEPHKSFYVAIYVTNTNIDILPSFPEYLLFLAKSRFLWECSYKKSIMAKMINWYWRFSAIPKWVFDTPTLWQMRWFRYEGMCAYGSHFSPFRKFYHFPNLYRNNGEFCYQMWTKWQTERPSIFYFKQYYSWRWHEQQVYNNWNVTTLMKYICYLEKERYAWFDSLTEEGRRAYFIKGFIKRKIIFHKF